MPAMQHLFWHASEETISDVAAALGKACEEKDTDDLLPVFWAARAVMSLEDSQKQARIDAIMRALNDAMLKCRGFFNPTEVGISAWAKLGKFDADIREWQAANVSLWRWMHVWLTRHTTAPRWVNPHYNYGRVTMLIDKANRYTQQPPGLRRDRNALRNLARLANRQELDIGGWETDDDINILLGKRIGCKMRYAGVYIDRGATVESFDDSVDKFRVVFDDDGRAPKERMMAMALTWWLEGDDHGDQGVPRPDDDDLPFPEEPAADGEDAAGDNAQEEDNSAGQDEQDRQGDDNAGSTDAQETMRESQQAAARRPLSPPPDIPSDASTAGEASDFDM
jgi:hypothetical protein